jgi:hypothetical protein
MMVAPAIRAIAEQAPEEALQFLEGYDKRQFEYLTLQERNEHKERSDREQTKRWGMGFILAALCSVLLYSGWTGDKDLSEKVINVVVGAVGGLGAGAALFHKKED